jgi:hypothetical protein
MKLTDFLGYVVAILIITVIVGAGVTLIQTDGQLAVVLVGMIATVGYRINQHLHAFTAIYSP